MCSRFLYISEKAALYIRSRDGSASRVLFFGRLPEMAFCQHQNFQNFQNLRIFRISRILTPDSENSLIL